jgi:hypothetical protein
MAKNRKTQSGAVRLVPLLKAVVICSLIGGSAVGYVLQKNNIFELGLQLREREARLERLKWDNKIRVSRLAELQFPQRLAERVQELRLGLAPARPAQVIWLAEPSPPKSTRPSPSYLAQQNR